MFDVVAYPEALLSPVIIVAEATDTLDDAVEACTRLCEHVERDTEDKKVAGFGQVSNRCST